MALTISKPYEYTRATIIQDLGYLPRRELNAQQQEDVSSAELRFQNAQGDTNNIGLYNTACKKRETFYRGVADYVSKAIKMTTDEANTHVGDAGGAKANLIILNDQATAYITGAKMVFGKDALLNASANTLTLSDTTALTITCSANIDVTSLGGTGGAAADLGVGDAAARVAATNTFLQNLRVLEARLKDELTNLETIGYKNPVLKIKSDQTERELESAAATIKETLEANNVEIAKYLEEADAKDDRSLLSTIYKIGRLMQIAQLVFGRK
jgi:hypothetical protein